MRYIASMQLPYEKAFECIKCTDDDGPRYVTMDGTATSIQRIHVVSDPLAPAAGPPKESTDKCVARTFCCLRMSVWLCCFRVFDDRRICMQNGRSAVLVWPA
jgi:hypothetical protein